MKNTFLKTGYALFSPVHLLTLGINAGAMTALCRTFEHMDQNARKKMLKVTSLIPLSMEAVQDLLLAVRGSMSVQYLPFHLCGHAIFWEALHAHLKKGRFRKKLGEMIWSMFMPGAMMALVFPGWNNLPLLNPVSLKKYAAHFFLVLYGILIDLDGQVSLKKGNQWQEILYMYAAGIALIPFNEHFGTNYMYTHEAVEPIGFVWRKWGRSAYILVLMAAAVVMEEVMYGIHGHLHEYQERQA